MNPLAALFAPLLLLVPGATAIDAVRTGAGGIEGAAQGHADAGRARQLVPPPPDTVRRADVAEGPGWTIAAHSFRAPVQEQVRIEQRMTIRIAPRAPAIPPPMFIDLPRQGMGQRFTERRFGRCLPMSGIAGVQSGGGNRLLLFLRDQRILSAELEKSCRARDFYSGFYVDRNADGQICIDRDMLHSRSGSNCTLTRLRQLVDVED